MKIALCTTTINVPHVLALYRKCREDVRFFVAGDHKTPLDAQIFCTSLPNTLYIPPSAQLHWKCSPLLGWDCIQRRNIAFLEALKWGADIIVTIDDDNLPIDEDYFADTEMLFDPTSIMRKCPFHGLQASSVTGWFNPSSLLMPPTVHRGFPYDVTSAAHFEPVTDARVGVVAGTCLGDPDIAAYTRMATHPEIHGVSELLRAGVVVAPDTWTVFNSQNTAFLRELTPAMFMAPGLGRFDDIFASLITQRVMRDRGLQVHLGKPFVWQQRNDHDLMVDLNEETFGMANIRGFAEFLAAPLIQQPSVLDSVRDIYNELYAIHLVPPQACEAALAFLEDCELVL